MEYWQSLFVAYISHGRLQNAQVIPLCFALNFHERACARENCVLCVFELLTDDTEHSEAIKTDTKMCDTNTRNDHIVHDRSTLEFQHTTVSRQQGLN